MEYIVPQFIEREPRIFGPFTFKQFILVGIAGGISIFLYFMIKSFALFLLLALVLIGGASSLAFLKRGGASLPKILQNFFIFLGRPKIYLWKKKTIPPKIFQKIEKPKKEDEEEESVLKIAKRSRLRNLHTLLETKSNR